ncbi:MBOAT, membrane-bound O-acyltransferase family-domain-containing protein [Spinellus fusiger]|nr:MBOAT, membrane-bound O-acyltransferase family-domain-containing protein [Spinellus fusiger]
METEQFVLKVINEPHVTYEQSPPTIAPKLVNQSSPLSPALWNTREFYCYYVCFAIVVPYMLYEGYSLSKEDNLNYSQFEHLLSKGWIMQRSVDNSDVQYRGFRDNIPKLILLAAVYLGPSHLFRHYMASKTTSQSGPLYRLYFFLSASLIILTILYGSSVLKILIIVSMSYTIGQMFQGSLWNPTLTWVFSLGMLFLNQLYHGYSFESLGQSFAWLDSYQGINMRWHILFNFTILRLISFNMDRYWQVKTSTSQYNLFEQTSGTFDGELITDKMRNTIPCPKSDYNYVYFLAYVLYMPLYMCGPIITYNNFISQIRYPSQNITTRGVAMYALRLSVVILVMEITLHFIYVVAISKAKAWDGDSAFQLSMIGYFNLLIIWMKLLIPWRFFRLWALMDGLWPEENMVRCMSNNFSAQRFWKSWHRSFNLWTIRYIYIPLGGSKYMIYNIWIVFTFVAVWHDIELKLFAWGWLICLFLVPEIVASRVYSFAKYGQTKYYRFICGVGAVGNILMMMAANLVGFSIGLDGLKSTVSNMFRTNEGFLFFLIACVCIFVGVQVMFEIRASEKRRGDPKWKM